MKLNRFIPILSLIIIFIVLENSKVLAQKDSMRRDTISKEYKENPDASYYLKRKAQFENITRTKIEEKSMLKIDFQLISIDFYENLTGISIGYEKKLSPDFSLLAEAGYDWFSLRKDITYQSLDVTLATRYYYNMPKRIWEGINANNLSGNYFSIQCLNYLSLPASSMRYILFPELLYGIQRRLGKVCFFDINGGLGFEIVPQRELFVAPGIIINAKLGFGL